MKTKEMAKRGLYLGAGLGLALFALIGLLPGSFIGGVVGLNIAGSLFGLPLSASLMPRMIVGVAMVLGVMVSGVVFVVGISILGWLAGSVVDAVRYGRSASAVRETAKK